MADVETKLVRDKSGCVESRCCKVERTSLWNNLPKPNIAGWTQFYPSRTRRCAKFESWTERRIKINVGGRRFQTMESTLRRYPETLLGCSDKEKYYDNALGEYFFDRDPGFFRHILNFYRKGKLHFSQFHCGLPYDEELTFYRIDSDYIGTCCREEYESMYIPESEATKTETKDEKEKREKLNLATPDIVLGDTLREKIYTIFKYPQVNMCGRLAFYLVASAIIVSVVTTVIETVSCGNLKCGEKYPIVFRYIDGACVLIFIVEFAFRFYAAKQRLKHVRSLNTVIDALAILPFFVNITISSVSDNSTTELQALVILRVFRIFRVFKLMRISERLQFLGRSLKASAPDLLFLCFTILIGVLIFSTIIFFAEQGGEKSNFRTIPEAMWFGAQTMTTLGYGDVTPNTALGKVVAAVFCLGGILVIALPVPIIEMKQKLTAQYERSLKNQRNRTKHERTQTKIANSSENDEHKLDCCQLYKEQTTEC
eukprot:gene8063-8926_t